MKITLDMLDDKDLFDIVKINTQQNELRKRLIEMGFHKGVRGSVLRKAPLGDPIQIRLLGYDVSLRKAEAREIQVERTVEEKP